ncbi:MAG: DUF2065 domain-containing protein [Pseudomonadales bacterium]
MGEGLFYQLATALCLVLVIEGILPFAYPARWRKLVAQIAQIDDATLRAIGFVSMLLGVVGLYIVR